MDDIISQNLAAARRTDQRHHFTRFDDEVVVLADLGVGTSRVAEVDVAQLDATGQSSRRLDANLGQAVNGTGDAFVNGLNAHNIKHNNNAPTSQHHSISSNKHSIELTSSLTLKMRCAACNPAC